MSVHAVLEWNIPADEFYILRGDPPFPGVTNKNTPASRFQAGVTPPNGEISVSLVPTTIDMYLGCVSKGETSPAGDEIFDLLIDQSTDVLLKVHENTLPEGTVEVRMMNIFQTDGNTKLSCLVVAVD